MITSQLRNDNQNCFAAVCDDEIRVLILGSFPGEKSLAERQYYAHPRNAFWNILSEILGFDNTVSYPEKIEILKKNRIGLWDVIQMCRRKGSLDSNIHADTIKTNNFKEFFTDHTKVKVVFFNGCRAEAEFRKRVVPELTRLLDGITLKRLPSTSPAMAMMSYAEKLNEWGTINRYVSNGSG